MSDVSVRAGIRRLIDILPKDNLFRVMFILHKRTRQRVIVSPFARRLRVRFIYRLSFVRIQTNQPGRETNLFICIWEIARSGKSDAIMPALESATPQRCEY